MSFEALRWASSLKLKSAHARSLMWALADAATKAGVCVIGQKTLAKHALLSDRKVFSLLSELENDGLIERRRRQRLTGSRTADEITLRMGSLLAPRAGSLTARRASRQSPETEGLTAPGASCLLAPGAELTRTGCEAFFPKENIPPLTPNTESADMPVRDALTAIGVSAETAEAVMIAFAVSGSPLDLQTVQPVCRQLDGPDPEDRARRMLENGLLNEGGGRPSRAKARPAVPAQPHAPTRHVIRDLEPDLWRRCCQAVGRAETLTDKRGGWSFPLDVVERLGAGGPDE